MKKSPILLIFLGSLVGVQFFLPMMNFDWFIGNTDLVGNYVVQLTCLLILAILYLMKSPKRLIHWGMTDLLVGCYVLYLLLVHVLPDPLLFATLKIHALLSAVLIYVTIKSLLFRIPAQRLKTFMLGVIALFLVSVVIQGLIAGLQLFGFVSSQDPNFNLSGTFPLISYLAMYMGLGLPVALGVYVSQKEPEVPFLVLRYLALGAVVVAGFILPYTANRSSWLMAMVGITIVLVLQYHPEVRYFLRSARRRMTVLAIFCLCLIGGAIFLYQFKPASANGRLVVWKVILDKAGEAPLFGQGLDAVARHYPMWQSAWFGKGHGTAAERMLADQVHVAYNEYLGVMSETGLMGLILLVGIIYFGIAHADLKRKEVVPAVWLSLIGGLLTAALFSYPFSQGIFLQLFFLSLGILSSKLTHSVRTRVPRSGWVTGGLACLVLAALMGRQLVITRQVHDDLSFAMIFKGSGSYQDAVPLYEDIYPAMRHDPGFIAEYADLLLRAGQAAKSVDLIQQHRTFSCDRLLLARLGNSYRALKEYDLAEQAFWEAYHIAPSRFLPLYALAKMHERAGNIVRAKDLAQTILDKKVKVDSPAVRQIKREMKELLDQLNAKKDA